MSLQFPLALALAALAFAVILFHLFRKGRTRVRVPSLLFWARRLPSAEQTRFLTRLRPNLRLALQILAVVLFALSLAGPSIRLAGAPTPTGIIIVLDSSASMQVDSGGSSRFDRARTVALEILNGMSANALGMVLAADSELRALSSQTSDKAVLRNAVRNATPSDANFDSEEVFDALASLSGREETARIVLISDTAFEAPRFLPASLAEAGISVRSVAEDEAPPNVGISAFEFRRRTDLTDVHELFLRVSSSGVESLDLTLIFSVDELEIGRRELSLSSEAPERSLVFEYGGPMTGIAEARLALDDALASDNAAQVKLDPRPARLLLLSAENRFLAEASAALPNIEAFSPPEPGEIPAGADIAAFDLLIVHARSAPPTEGLPTLVFADDAGRLPPGIPVALADEQRDASIESVSGSHPVLRNANLRSVFLSRYRPLLLPPQAEVLGRANGRPVAAALEFNDTRYLIFGFSLDASDLGIRSAFPVLLADSIAWLADDPSIFEPVESFAVNEAVVLPRGTVSVELPTGELVELSEGFDRGRGSVFAGTSEAGVYIARAADGGGQRFAVNLLDEGESDIRPRFTESGETGGDPRAEQAGAGPVSEQGLGLVVAALLALVLLTDWYIGARRV